MSYESNHIFWGINNSCYWQKNKKNVVSLVPVTLKCVDTSGESVLWNVSDVDNCVVLLACVVDGLKSVGWERIIRLSNSFSFLKQYLWGEMRNTVGLHFWEVYAISSNTILRTVCKQLQKSLNVRIDSCCFWLQTTYIISCFFFSLRNTRWLKIGKPCHEFLMSQCEERGGTLISLF